MKTPKLKPLASAFGAFFLTALSAFAEPTVTSPPADQLVEEIDGKTITMTVVANTDEAGRYLEYRWYKNNAPLDGVGVSGQTSPTLKLTKLTAASTGVYFCRVFEGGSDTPSDPPRVDSSLFNLTVHVRPTVKTQPAPQLKEQDSGVSFTVELADQATTEGLEIRWQKNNVDINAVTNSTAITVGSRTSTFTIPAYSPPVDETTPGTPGVQWGDIGNYRAKITNSKTNTTIYSKVAALKVNSAAVILKQPAADTGGTLYIAANGSGKLTVVAGGNTPLKYQWQKETEPGVFTDIAKATAASLSLKDSATVGAEGRYRVQVTNPLSKSATNPGGKDPAVSVAAEVVVLNKITAAPITPTSSASANAKGEYPAGATFSLTVAPTGDNTGVLEYQWQKDSKNIVAKVTAPGIVDGVNTATLNLSPLDWTHRGVYRCIVKNKVGTLTSKTFTLKVDSPPIILTQPPDEVVIPEGKSAVLSVVAGGNAPLKYQWFRRVEGVDSEVPKATAAKLTIKGTTGAAADYFCKVSNYAYGEPALKTVDSEIVKLVVEQPVAISTITANPPNAQVLAGEIVTLTVLTSKGTLPVTFQWQKNGKDLPIDGPIANSRVEVTNLPEGTYASAVLEIPVDSDTVGTYRCIVSNVRGQVKVTSKTIVVKALGAPVIVQEPEAETEAFKYSTVTLSVKAGGSPPLKYQWERKLVGDADFTPMSGMTAASLKLTNLSFSNHQGLYRCVVSNPTSAKATSIEASLEVLPIPNLTIENMTPKVSRSGDKIRLTGPHLEDFLKSVKLGSSTGTSLAFTDDPFNEDSVLITMPATAPLTDTPLVLTNIDDVAEISESPNLLKRSTVQVNDRRNPTIVVGTTFPVTQGATNVGLIRSGEVGGTLPESGLAEGIYSWVAPKKGYYNVTVFSPSQRFQMFLGVAINNQPRNAWLIFGTTYQQQQIRVDVDNTRLTFYVYGYSGDGVLYGLDDYGDYQLQCDYAGGFLASSSTFSADEGVSTGKLAGQAGWSVEGKTASAAVTGTEEEGQMASFTGSSGNAEPTVLWHNSQAIDAEAESSVLTTWTMGIDQAGAGTEGHYGWQITGADGSPIAQVQFSVADGAIYLVQPDGTRTETKPHLVPGSTHRFEITTDLKTDTWTARIDGMVLGEALPLPVKSGFGDVSVIWYPAAADGARPTMSFDDVNIIVE